MSDSVSTKYLSFCFVSGVIESDEATIRREFNTFGRIMEVRYFRDKGYAFIRYNNKESACSAIVAMHGKDIGGTGNPVKCSWGKESAPGPQDGYGGGYGYGGGGPQDHYGGPGGHQDNPYGGGGGMGGHPGHMDPNQQQQQQQYMQYNPQYMQQMQMHQQYYAQYAAAAQQAQQAGYGMQPGGGQPQ